MKSTLCFYWTTVLGIWISICISLHFPFGEGNGTPLQYSFTFMHWRRKWQTHSSVLAWRIPGTEEPGGLPPMGSHRVWHNWSDLAAAGTMSAKNFFGGVAALLRDSRPAWGLESHLWKGVPSTTLTLSWWLTCFQPIRGFQNITKRRSFLYSPRFQDASIGNWLEPRPQEVQLWSCVTLKETVQQGKCS